MKTSCLAEFRNWTTCLSQNTVSSREFISYYPQRDCLGPSVGSLFIFEMFFGDFCICIFEILGDLSSLLAFLGALIALVSSFYFSFSAF
jgi:hypothetical protein